ncbi:branched-chain amino acid ABC transporter permease [Hoeflea sp. WL0058]|uniref:Branched-chain amino acid ABC transporter permease n=1 Tax=Flavimaribacter sediminis TaxID=2865987 RepID=A0AAE2ZVV2_9HYPH|nr:branched-chain amino acid ABC transporter permease [Flavimaribacter sediminis]MBW8640682.1 branched-chain amino acid ABC transporter permease [Flavimaribacter sediminis]
MNRLLLIGLLLIVAIAAPFFVYPVLLMTVLCFVIFASSFNLLLGYAGLLCFGHAMFFGTAAYITGYVLKTTPISIEIAILGGALFSAAIGYGVALVSVRRSGIQFAMITLAISQFIYFVLLQSEFTGGEDGMQRIPRNDLFGVIDVADNNAYYYVVLAFAVAAVALVYRIVHSPYGEVLKAIRDNEPRVESLGFRPERYKVLAITLSAGLAGLGGALKATVFQFATLTDVSWTVSGEVILMTLMGGLGTLVGPMVGAGLVIWMNDELSQFGEWSLIAQGAILLLVIIFFRRGVVGEVQNLVRLVRSR